MKDTDDLFVIGTTADPVYQWEGEFSLSKVLGKTFVGLVLQNRKICSSQTPETDQLTVYTGTSLKQHSLESTPL